MKIAMVTGPSSGIGRATTLALARSGFHVVAAGRSPERIMKVVNEIEVEGGSAEFLRLDLASLDSCVAAAREFESSGRDLDVLINAAGVGAVKGLTDDGFEIHFGVNHLGHFMLTHHLRKVLRPGSRVVTVSSEVHRRATGIDFDAVRRRSRSLFGLQDYAVSKLANILFTRALARLQPDWRVYAVHPGLANTNIIPGYVRLFIGRRLLTPEQAADTVVWCATADEVAAQSGLYYRNRTVLEPAPPATDDGLGTELWRRSEEWCDVARRH
jgi:retinol dehydrogenase-12